MTFTRARTMVGVLLFTLVAVGCTRETSETSGPAAAQPKATGTPSACNLVSAPMTPIPSRADEPHVVIPQPTGWQRESEQESEDRRFAMANGNLRVGRIASASVELRTLVGHRDPATEIENMRAKAEKDSGNRDLTATDSEVCGFPGQTFRYIRTTAGLPPAAETLLVVVVPATGKTHEVALTTRTTHGNDPDYQRAIETILSGVQVLTPTA